MKPVQQRCPLAGYHFVQDLQAETQEQNKLYGTFTSRQPTSGLGWVQVWTYQKDLQIPEPLLSSTRADWTRRAVVSRFNHITEVCLRLRKGQASKGGICMLRESVAASGSQRLRKKTSLGRESLTAQPQPSANVPAPAMSVAAGGSGRKKGHDLNRWVHHLSFGIRKH